MNEPSHAEARRLISARLGGLSPEEERQLAAHLEGCAECAAEAREAEALFRLLDAADPARGVAVDVAALEARLLARLEEAAARPEGRRPVRWWAWLPAAAAALLVVALLLPRDGGPPAAGPETAATADLLEHLDLYEDLDLLAHLEVIEHLETLEAMETPG